LNNAEK